MKANSVPTETLLRGIPCDQWGIGWEAIMDATQKDIDFPTQGRIFAYIKTYIYRKEFQETYYHKRTKVIDENGNTTTKHEYIMRSLPVTHAMAVYGVSAPCEDDDDEYSAMIAGATADYSDDATVEIELRSDISRLGIPNYFIERIMDGERLVITQLTQQELIFLKLCRDAFSSFRTKSAVSQGNY